MSWFNNVKFPYLSMQQLNLDWLLNTIRHFLPTNDDDATEGQIIVRQSDGSAKWESPAGLAVDIHSLTNEATVDATDEFIFYDDSNAENRKITYANLENEILANVPGEFDIDALSAETSMANDDALPFYDDSADENKKITYANLQTEIAQSIPTFDIDTLTVASGLDSADKIPFYDVSANDTKAIEYDDIKTDIIAAAPGLDINSLTAETSIADADAMAFYDASADENKKITYANFKLKIENDLPLINFTRFGSLTVTPGSGYTFSNGDMRFAATDSGDFVKVYGWFRLATSATMSNTIVTLTANDFSFPAPDTAFDVYGTTDTIWHSGVDGGDVTTWKRYSVMADRLVFNTDGTSVTITSSNHYNYGYRTVFVYACIIQTKDFND